MRTGICTDDQAGVVCSSASDLSSHICQLVHASRTARRMQSHQACGRSGHRQWS